MRTDAEQMRLLESWTRLQKVELHCHLDGALRSETVQRWMEEDGHPLSLEEVRRQLQVSTPCHSLVEYLRCFALPTRVLDRRSRFVEATKDLMQQAEREGIRYLEIRYAPNLHRTHLAPEETIEAVLEGIQSMQEKQPRVQARLLLCILRGVDRTEAEQRQILDWAQRYRDMGVCGIDLAGDEKGYPLHQYEGIFREAQRRDLRYTLHAGEAGGPEEVWEALRLGATRVGHGIAAHADPHLLEALAEKQVLCELCPTSNLQTCSWPEEQPYPLLRFVEAGVPCLLNTDNRTVSGTTLPEEWLLLEGQDKRINMQFARARQVEGLAHAFIEENLKREIAAEWK